VGVAHLLDGPIFSHPSTTLSVPIDTSATGELLISERPADASQQHQRHGSTHPQKTHKKNTQKHNKTHTHRVT
jgi:hypothetical protein